MRMKVIDFTYCGFGLLVTHSSRYKKQHGIKSRKKDIGIIVDKSFFDDNRGGCICYPRVHWEDEVMARSCHPANIVPYRKHNLPEKECD
jgi:hypothetical protein